MTNPFKLGGNYMMLLKACPRCGGDLSVDHDDSCGYLECVQCGHILSHRQEMALGVRITRHGALRHSSSPLREQVVDRARSVACCAESA
jgi:hypothetical protein